MCGWIGLKPSRRLAGIRFISLLHANKRSICGEGPWTRRPVLNSSNIFNSNGIRVAVVNGTEVFSLSGQKLYEVKGAKIYRISGELIGHLNEAVGSDKRLDRSNDRLFPISRT